MYSTGSLVLTSGFFLVFHLISISTLFPILMAYIMITYNNLPLKNNFIMVQWLAQKYNSYRFLKDKLEWINIHTCRFQTMHVYINIRAWKCNNPISTSFLKTKLILTQLAKPRV